jgi:hypothetical protein
MKKLLIIPLLLIPFAWSCSRDTDCPPNYTGSKCDKEISPGRIRITRVQFTSYPGTNSGQNWDQNSLWADPYFIITTNGALSFESAYLNDMAPTAISQWETDIVLLPDDSHIIAFFDEDGNQDTYIDGTTFVPYENGEDFPERRTFYGNSGSQISIWVQYEY